MYKSIVYFNFCININKLVFKYNTRIIDIRRILGSDRVSLLERAHNNTRPSNNIIIPRKSAQPYL